MFLWVFLHEAAHLETHRKYSVKVPPHGHEWQMEYAQLLADMLEYFPPETRPTIILYASKIPLTRATGRKIEEMLRHYDSDYQPEVSTKLDDLPPGSLFRLKNKPELLFRSEEHRRTRWLCVDVATGRHYTVSGTAVVIKESK